MDRVLDGFTTCLNFTLSDRAPPDKIALAEGGTVLFEMFVILNFTVRASVPPSASAILSGGARSLSLKIQTRSKTVEHTVHGGAKRPSIC